MTILSADIAACSRLMERDETGTLAELMERQSATLRSLQEYMLHDSDLDVLRSHPRFAGIVKKPGDCR
ncbi:MAG: hypothetical protein IOC82_14665 [Aestuariivirga sp.]|uniref:hypothetical protein n=1 Tax=Aestuariivirga sp. TaxID=2650926 RepID=UPI0025BDDB78|nr:hypothetical protein [Aestuariivirga sp.]MCA3562264.1 hypothetical protein [Aestuariivirga sp.]